MPVSGEGAIILEFQYQEPAAISVRRADIHDRRRQLLSDHEAGDNSRAVAHNVDWPSSLNRSGRSQHLRPISLLDHRSRGRQLRQSEVNAKATRESLLQRLDDFAVSKPVEAAALKRQVAHFEEAALSAVEQYTDDQRVLGNTLLAEARQHSVRINDRLSAIVDGLNREVLRARDQVVSDVAQTTRIAYALVVLTIILGITLTLVILRSILVPLRQVTAAMDGITAGDLNTPIPPASGDEIGLMAKTLQLFRESIVERTRLADESDRQRRLIETALRTISDGFVLYGPDDRLVLCNSKFRDLYPRIADLIVPGIPFPAILRAVVDRKLIDLDGKTPDGWIAERMRQHTDPKGFSEYQYNALGCASASGECRMAAPSRSIPTSPSSNSARPSSNGLWNRLTKPIRQNRVSSPTCRTSCARR